MCVCVSPKRWRAPFLRLLGSLECSFHCVCRLDCCSVIWISLSFFSYFFFVILSILSILFHLYINFPSSFWCVCVCACTCTYMRLGCVLGWGSQSGKGEQRGTGWGGGGPCAPGREAISQLVCSLGSQAENAADLWSKLKWCQFRNKAPS